jgi:hypothetical protein
MNFANAPELDWEEGFLAIFGIMTLLGIPIFLYFKKRDWICCRATASAIGTHGSVGCAPRCSVRTTASSRLRV